MMLIRGAFDCGLALVAAAGDSLLRSPHAVANRTSVRAHDPVCVVHLVLIVRFLLNRQTPPTARSSRARLRERSTRAWLYSSCQSVRWQFINRRSSFVGYSPGRSSIGWSTSCGSDRDLRKDPWSEIRKGTA